MNSPATSTIDSMNQQLLAALHEPSFYPDPTTTVELRETHISWVFLTDRYVYKLKKPVHFAFLDFSTLEQRRAACEAELHLNRRLAPEIYLDVIAVVRDEHDQLQLIPSTFQSEAQSNIRSTSGCSSSSSFDIDSSSSATAVLKHTIVDYLVKMRRLPDQQALDQLITTGRVTDDQVERIARRLVEFYRQQPPLALAGEDYRCAISEHVAANRTELLQPQHELDKTIVERIHAAQQRLLTLHPDWWDTRVCDGRVIDGHGDLRPEHVYVNSHVVVIDALEFSRELRQIDVLDELGFLAMECGVLGAPEMGERIIRRYQDELHDHPPAALIRFYESYRAMVRAKVAVLRSHQLTAAAQVTARQLTQRYMEWADERLGSWLPAGMIVVSGLSGTGKSVVAATIAARYQGRVLSTDQLRSEELPRDSELAAYAGQYGAARYAPQRRDEVYELLLQRAAVALKAERFVILDGTFLRSQWIEAAQQLAAEHRAEFLLIRCECPLQVARERVLQRAARGDSTSEMTAELLERQFAERPSDWELQPHLRLDTTQSLAELLAAVDDRCRLWMGVQPDQR
ncbi:MAG: AAA family ATPase [Planctomycetota bacterium]